MTEVVDSGDRGIVWSYVITAVNVSGETHAIPPPVDLFAGVCQPPPDAPLVSVSGSCVNASAVAHVTWTAMTSAISYTILRDGVTQKTGLSPSSLVYDDVLTTGFNLGAFASYAVRAILPVRTVTSSSVSGFAECLVPPPVLTAVLASCDNVTNHAVVHLSWTVVPFTGNHTATSVLRFTDGHDDGVIGGFVSQATMFDDQTVVPGHTYQYRVTLDVDGFPVSNPASITTCPAQQAPPPPSVTVSSECNGSVALAHLAWSTSAGATSYAALRNGSQIGTAASTTFDDTSALPNQSYVYVVRAIGPGGSSDSTGSTLAIVPCVVPHADLSVFDVTVFPPFAAPGELVTTSFSLANIGARDAAATTTRVAIGSGPNAATSDVLLAYVATPPLPAGTSKSQSVTAAVPSPFEEGTFYVFVLADDAKVTDDVNATNDVARSPALQVTAPAPCVLSCLASAPSSGIAQQLVTLVTTASCPDSTVIWDLGDNTIINGTSTVAHAYAQPGTYRWTVRVSLGAEVCEKSGTIDVAAQQAPPKRRAARH
ncbi:MAG TPA: PKD domain-containing protein [Thermoanaerobaculia bacterium]|nr:PKD domain-containing protein [Thermoanaerobaculia bacterium]